MDKDLYKETYDEELNMEDPNEDEEGREAGCRRRTHWLRIVIICALVLVCGYFIFMGVFKLNAIRIEWNAIYSDQEILNMVSGGETSGNTLFYYLKYKNPVIEGVPFMDHVEVVMVDRNTIAIDVYEKGLVGCVQYMNSYMYFDSSGIVVESSQERKKDVPLITGLTFDSMVLNETLAIEDEEVYSGIMNLTQLLKKFELTVERIELAADKTMTLYFEDVRVQLGKSQYLEEKISEFKDLVPNLNGLKGVLHLEDYDPSKDSIIFTKDS